MPNNRSCALSLLLAGLVLAAACSPDSYPGAPGDPAPAAAPQEERQVAPEAVVAFTLPAAQAQVAPPREAWLHLLELHPAALEAELERAPGEDRPSWIKRRAAALRLGKQALLQRHGLAPEALWYPYPTLPMVGVWVTGAQLTALERDKAVVRSWPGQWVEPSDTSSLTFLGMSPDGEGNNPDASAGSQTTVAVIDTAPRYWESAFGDCGTQGNPDLNKPGCHVVRRSNHLDCARLPQIAPGWECVPGTDTYEGVAVNDDHGTNVSGIVHSVAPGATLWMMNAAHIIRPTGSGGGQVALFNADVVAALEEIHADPGAVASVNLSLGSARSENQSSYCASAYHVAMRGLWHDHGIVSVVASGNDSNKNAVSSPACDTYAVTVGAQYDTDYVGYQASFSHCTEIIGEGAVTCFSNSQTAVDIVAPGGWITAAGVTQAGTSQATPHVAGYAALLQSEALRSDSGKPLSAPALLHRLRRQSTNRAESATGRDGAPRSYQHRQLTQEPSLDPTHSYVIYGDPTGYGVGPGQEVSFTLDTANFVQEQGDLNGHTVQGAWLDVTLATSDASLLRLTLVSPAGTSYALPVTSGANLNYLYGDQVAPGLKDAFDQEQAGGQWTLRVANLHGQEVVGLLRAALHLKAQATLFQMDRDPSFGAFSLEKTSVAADGMEVQTLHLTLNDADSVDDVRILINFGAHAQNGLGYSGYFRVTPERCHEITASYGNTDVELLTDQCTQTLNQDGSVDYVVKFVAEPSYPASTNNQISVLWLEDGVAGAGWVRATAPGAGFDVTEAVGEVQRPSTFGSFSMDEASIVADGVEVQTLRLTLNDAANVDDVRLLINYAPHAENGESYAGYLRITPERCHELTASYGNTNIALQEDTCERNTNMDGSTEYVLRFVAQPGLAAASNYQVSVLWFEDGNPRSTWRRATSPGAGFDVTEAVGEVQRPSTFGSFSMDQASVVADGLSTQTFRLTLNDAANVDDVRFLINFRPHTENGLQYSGYFRVTPERCHEITSNYGNDKVALQEDTCERNTNMDGSTEYVLHFTVDPLYGANNNNQVSLIWFEDGSPRSSWRRVTTSGAGFDVTLP